MITESRQQEHPYKHSPEHTRLAYNLIIFLEPRSIMAFDKMIPVTFQPALEPLAQHIIDSQKSPTPLEPPPQFKTGRRLAFAMVKGTIERQRKKYTIASDLNKSIITAIPVVDDWRIIRPLSESSGIRFPQPGELLDDGTIEFLEGEIPGDRESKSDTTFTNGITIYVAQSININISVNLLELDYTHHIISVAKPRHFLRLFAPSRWDIKVQPTKWRAITQEDGWLGVVYESDETYQSVKAWESDKEWESDGSWDNENTWL
ncbi:hypothetical protein B0J13DRAFT_604015 [Dactylonectria estremocensis]|uniref:Uncharacterized protein n=1 Tax=Dactylonectria estremocensis TaxID=1079267 RepID=A0A9P9J779_9HYPO|nr:hypothetical protein B0J13DRAFT_604015 [Dactylonectria estremocensis]